MLHVLVNSPNLTYTHHFVNIFEQLKTVEKNQHAFLFALSLDIFKRWQNQETIVLYSEEINFQIVLRFTYN